jgi:hypothetical protein
MAIGIILAVDPVILKRSGETGPKVGYEMRDTSREIIDSRFEMIDAR